MGVGGGAAKKERLLIITCVSREKGSQSSLLVHQQEGQQGKRFSIITHLLSSTRAWHQTFSAPESCPILRLMIRICPYAQM